MSLPAYHFSRSLSYPTTCLLLGVTAAGEVVIDELYGEDEWRLRSVWNDQGEQVAQFDEQPHPTAFNAAPALAHVPQSAQATRSLNYSGPRLRGQRDAELVRDVVQELPLSSKMALVQRLKLTLLPPQVLGIAESNVLSEAMLQPPDLFMVCRRVRIAYALPSPRADEEGERYDYDSLTLHLLHPYTLNTDPALETSLNAWPGVPLRHPLDCLIVNQRLIVTDAGLQLGPNQWHVWTLTN